MMSGIRSTDTKPEVQIRKGLFARKFRFLKNRKGLPGRPDIVFPKYRAVIQVHGCFWHGHECVRFKWPKTRAAEWKTKILGNRERDRMTSLALEDMGWRVLTVWECSMRGPERRSLDEVLDRAEEWLKSGSDSFVIAGAK